VISLQAIIEIRNKKKSDSPSLQQFLSTSALIRNRKKLIKLFGKRDIEYSDYLEWIKYWCQHSNHVHVLNFDISHWDIWKNIKDKKIDDLDKLIDLSSQDLKDLCAELNVNDLDELKSIYLHCEQIRGCVNTFTKFDATHTRVYIMADHILKKKLDLIVYVSNSFTHKLPNHKVYNSTIYNKPKLVYETEGITEVKHIFFFRHRESGLEFCIGNFIINDLQAIKLYCEGSDPYKHFFNACTDYWVDSKEVEMYRTNKIIGTIIEKFPSVLSEEKSNLYPQDSRKNILFDICHLLNRIPYNGETSIKIPLDLITNRI